MIAGKILELKGDELSNYGKLMFESMGLVCVDRLKQVPLKELDPAGAYNSGDNCEFDYLIPLHGDCLVVEITGRHNNSKVEGKYRHFVRSLNILKKAKVNSNLWQLLGVPAADISHFKNVTSFRGLFMANKVDQYDVLLEKKKDVAISLASEVRQLSEYTDAIGKFAKDLFLSSIGMAPQAGKRPIELSKTDHNLFATCGVKLVSGDDAPLGDILTFEANPYDLLVFLLFYRRDMLASLSVEPYNYQRALDPKKLDSIRKNLLKDPNFVFPNSILLLLSKDCNFVPDENKLRIAHKPGAVSVIDGQHRLFSYADPEIKEKTQQNARIIASAISFDSASKNDLRAFGARAFVEINHNQTTIDKTHIQAIAYDILGRRDRHACAAKILHNANSRRDQKNPLYGLFATGESLTGVVAAKTVLSKLATLCRVEDIRQLGSVRRGKTKRYRKRLGYQRSLALDSNELRRLSHDDFVSRFTSALIRYFHIVKNVFPYDFPQKGDQMPGSRSALGYSKMIAAFVRLFGDFIFNGKTWNAMDTSIHRIQTNVSKLTRPMPNDRIMPVERSEIPDANDKQSVMLRFLRSNIERKTPVDKIR